MSDQAITLTLSRADAALLSDLADEGLAQQVRWLCSPSLTPEYRAELVQLSNDGRRIIDALDAAPAEGPERDIETLPLPQREIIAQKRVTLRFVEDRPPLVWRGDFDDALAEGPERAATGELEALIAECEAQGWEWSIARTMRPRGGVTACVGSHCVEGDDALDALRHLVQRITKAMQRAAGEGSGA